MVPAVIIRFRNIIVSTAGGLCLLAVDGCAAGSSVDSLDGSPGGVTVFTPRPDTGGINIPIPDGSIPSSDGGGASLRDTGTLLVDGAGSGHDTGNGDSGARDSGTAPHDTGTGARDSGEKDAMSTGHDTGVMPSHDAGAPPDLCYQCAGGTDAAVCGVASQQMPAGGVCPTGFTDTVPTCAPCWQCATSVAYCPSTSACGTWTSTGVVGAGETCYGCEGFAYEFDEATACSQAQTWSHSGGPSPNSTCPYPSGSEQASCGYYPAPTGCDCYVVNPCTSTCAL